jgi:hypothetical protein
LEIHPVLNSESSLTASRAYRDIKAVAIASAEFLKSRNPHSEVAMKDLQTGEVTVVVKAWAG